MCIFSNGPFDGHVFLDWQIFRKYVQIKKKLAKSKLGARYGAQLGLGKFLLYLYIFTYFFHFLPQNYFQFFMQPEKRLACRAHFWSVSELLLMGELDLGMHLGNRGVALVWCSVGGLHWMCTVCFMNAYMHCLCLYKLGQQQCCICVLLYGRHALDVCDFHYECIHAWVPTMHAKIRTSTNSEKYIIYIHINT